MVTMILSLFVFALVINIKTVPLIKESERLTAEIRVLEEKNASLYYQIESQTTFEHIQQKANELNLKPISPHQMEHIHLHHANIN